VLALVPDLGISRIRALLRGTPKRATQRAELASILGRRQTYFAVKETAKKSRILVTDLVSDGFDRPGSGLKHVLCLFEAQCMDVVERRHAGRLAKAANEGALRQ